jgi:DNA end-binding protein Ku
MPRPFWSGHVQISLVSFGVNLFSATESKSEIRFHQLNRKTGERIRHQKVSGDGGDSDASPVEKDEIVKGYEYRKGQYVMIEPGEIENLRVPSKHTFAVTQFVDLKELEPEYYEKPYFVVPENDMQAEAFAVVRKALQETGKAALGKIAFSGREHLMAIAAPPEAKDDTPAARGMMAYTLRYAAELRDPATYFADIKKTTVDADQLALAKELIQRKTAKFEPQKYTDDYEAALKALVEAKVNHMPIPKDEPAPQSGKVINLMDALRKSVKAGSDEAAADGAARTAVARKKPVARATEAVAEDTKGLSLVTPASAKAKSHRSRKSA